MEASSDPVRDIANIDDLYDVHSSRLIWICTLAEEDTTIAYGALSREKSSFIAPEYNKSS
jgi:hypothetical protein